MNFNYPAIIPYVPEYITVHLGVPASNALNVTIPFVEYIKNVASSELYPDWPEEALKANIYSIVSFTLNRVFTEWYPSMGYDFDITNTTQFDHAFVNGRNYFDDISQLVDELFNDYITLPTQIEPFFAQYCDGVRTICDGLSQWGTVDLANQGMSAFEILEYYYGDRIQLVENAPVLGVQQSYPGRAFRLGDESLFVRYIQIILNEVGRTYSSIPSIPDENGIFDESTDAAVRAFQRIFQLQVDGIVGKATWYSLIRLFTSLNKLASLNSTGISLEYLTNQYQSGLSPGDIGFTVELIQFFLNYLSQFNDYLSPVLVTGTYDNSTTDAVKNFQAFNGLPVTGIVDVATGNAIYDAYMGTFNNSSSSRN